MMKVIYHVDEREKWLLTLNNVRNMIDYYQLQNMSYQIEVLANSEAVIDYQKDSHLQPQMNLLSQKNVMFAACQNALNSQNMTKQQLLEFVEIVDAGVVELALKQSQGYSYIKP